MQCVGRINPAGRSAALVALRQPHLAARAARRVQQQGQGLDILGTVLAWAGWIGAAGVVFLVLLTLAESGAPVGAARVILLQLAVAVAACLAVAGIGHLLRAVAQVGRNMHRLAALLREARPPS